MKRQKRKLILASRHALGDITLMTAAVRDLHRCFPGQFVTDVRTSCGTLWNYNPHLRHLDGKDPEVKTLELAYPLIDYSNRVPYHAIHGYIDSLGEQLGIEIHATEFKGDIYLSPQELGAPSAVARLVGQEVPYWVVAAGGKYDIPIKWWESGRYQHVVDAFEGRILFVQVGGKEDYHPGLNGVIDLRGQTSVRELVLLVHHAQGVLCGVTGLMHLAAAVPVRDPKSGLRPCVVVAGGREPSHWEAYPHHQFIHTIGALPCCAVGGCWKSHPASFRYPTGQKRAKRSSLCTNLVSELPRCMDLIAPEEVIRRIEMYFLGSRIQYLRPAQARLVRKVARATRMNGAERYFGS
jgi:ADP-heptose:LPS heptosyltransferase